MSILDKFRRSANKAKEQADHVVDQHGDKIAKGVEKTGGAVSKVTGHRFDDKIDKGVHKAKERLEHDDSAETPPGPAATTPGSPESPAGPTSSAAPEPPPAPEPSTTDDPPSDPRPGRDSGPTT